jgi:selenide, water dikinase
MKKLKRQHLVLVGGGHAHVQVIKALHAGVRPGHLDITLIDRVVAASYSGMVPGCIAQLYHPDETLLALPPLAYYSSIHFCHDTVTDIDFENKVVYTANHDPASFDVISIDIGSASRDWSKVPGARQFSIPTRPIHTLIARLEKIDERLVEEATSISCSITSTASSKITEASLPEPNDFPIDLTNVESMTPGIGSSILEPHLVVVGGGVSGIELAMSVTSRWQLVCGADHPVSCTLLDAGPKLLPQESDMAREALYAVLHCKSISVRHCCLVKEITPDHTIIVQDTRHPSTIDTITFTHCIWAAGPGAHELAFSLGKHRGLPISTHGWIEVTPELQSTKFSFLFAAGDCCTITNLPDGAPSPPKAGVHAVRAGPILIENLTRTLANLYTSSKPTREQQENETWPSDDQSAKPLLRYHPQGDFMKLLVCGGGIALGFRFGIPMMGKWVWELKNDIDRKFMALFDVQGLEVPCVRDSKVDTLNTAAEFDTRQYDDEDGVSPTEENVMGHKEAARHILRSDDEVLYTVARSILRRMESDLCFRNQVLSHIYPPVDGFIEKVDIVKCKK